MVLLSLMLVGGMTGAFAQGPKKRKKKAKAKSNDNPFDPFGGSGFGF